MWRLHSCGQFIGTWLSDYVLNRLSGFIEQNQDILTERTKPDCALISEDRNIFNLMEITSHTLRE